MQAADARGSRTLVFLFVASLALLTACGGVPPGTTSPSASFTPNPAVTTPTTPTPTTGTGTTSAGTTGTTGGASTETGSGSGTTIQHCAALAWLASPSLVDGYVVYRSSQPGGPYSRITEMPIVLTMYSDNSVSAGQTYFYVVTAVVSGVESAYSNESEATIPAP